MNTESALTIGLLCGVLANQCAPQSLPQFICCVASAAWFYKAIVRAISEKKGTK